MLRVSVTLLAFAAHVRRALQPSGEDLIAEYSVRHVKTDRELCLSYN